MQNLIFRFLQSRQKVQIWLYHQTDLKLEGRVIVSISASVPSAVLAYAMCLWERWLQPACCVCSCRALMNT